MLRSPVASRRSTVWAAMMIATLVARCAAAGPGPRPSSYAIHTDSGIAVVGYAAKTSGQILAPTGAAVWSGTITNKSIQKIPLRAGDYVLKTQDEVCLITTSLRTFLPKIAENQQAPSGAPKRTVKILSGAGLLRLLPVPWPGDPSYANDNPGAGVVPNPKSRHTVFNGVPTRLKVVALGGGGNYSVTWDPGDGSGPQPAIGPTADGFNGLTLMWTYSGQPVGAQLTATATVTDGLATAVAHYYIKIGDPGQLTDRVNRATDEGLWWLHTQLSRKSVGAHGPTLACDEAYIYDGGAGAAYNAMFAIDLEQTNRSITGGFRYSNDPNKDALCYDLVQLMNWLTDSDNLVPINIAGQTKTFDHQVGAKVVDTHGPGGTPNNLALITSSGNMYHNGPHAQAICQAGFTDGAVPNRTDYSSFYDMVGDIVDGFQVSQGCTDRPEGGWRYTVGSVGYNDSDGSTAAWAGIALTAAEACNEFTPAPVIHTTPIQVASFTKIAVDTWITTDSAPDDSNWARGWDYLDDAARGHVGQARYFDRKGGGGYQGQWNGDNAAKTGGQLALLALIGKHADDPAVDPRVQATEGYLYRMFYTPDNVWNWNSARDSYAMYNMFKGLTEAHIVKLTDPDTSPFIPAGNNPTALNAPNVYTPGVTDRDGFVIPNGGTGVEWFPILANFIAGAGPYFTPGDPNPHWDLGHQYWPGNDTLGSGDGNFASTGTRGRVYPLYYSEWGAGSSDGSGGTILVTAWDLAVLQGTVLRPSPVAVIRHPDPTANENYVPIQLLGSDYYAVFDPAGSYDPNPGATIVKAHWEFGDGGSDEYNLPFPGNPVPEAPGVHPAGNQTTHHYSAIGDYAATLTVTDSLGLTATASITIHVIPAPFPPVAVLNVTTLNGSRQAGDTVGVLPDGTLTLKLDGAASYNPDVSTVNPPKNANGISNFLWEWPTNGNGTPTSDGVTPPYNVAAQDLLFDEGALDGSGTLNSGSKSATQTYLFKFNPGSLPSQIVVGLQVLSNINQINGAPPNTATVFKTLTLVPNDTLPPSSLAIRNLYAHNVTATTAVITFDTVDGSGNPVATTASVQYGTTTAYGSTKNDPTATAHHNIVLNSLLPAVQYHYKVTVTTPTTPPLSTSSGDNTFRTLPSAAPILSWRLISHDKAGSISYAMYQVTNTGGPAVNLYVVAGSYLANQGVTYNGPGAPPAPTLGTPITIPTGGTASFQVKWNLPATPPTSYMSKFTVKYMSTASVNYTSTPILVVPVP